VDILKTIHSRPIEREYEAWIVAGIERYCRRIHADARIWAVSPQFERHWPADEKLHIDGKLVGLQFKRADLAAGDPDLSRVNWSLAKPTRQYAAVLAAPEVFYCLPTFINRNYRREALHHCLFWRPGKPDRIHHAWYANPHALTGHRDLGASPDAVRWGRFVEGLQACVYGTPVRGAEGVSECLTRITSVFQEHELVRRKKVRRPREKPRGDTYDFEIEFVVPLYVVYVPLGG